MCESSVPSEPGRKFVVAVVSWSSERGSVGEVLSFCTTSPSEPYNGLFAAFRDASCRRLFLFKDYATASPALGMIAPLFKLTRGRSYLATCVDQLYGKCVRLCAAGKSERSEVKGVGGGNTESCKRIPAEATTG